MVFVIYSNNDNPLRLLIIDFSPASNESVYKENYKYDTDKQFVNNMSDEHGGNQIKSGGGHIGTMKQQTTWETSLRRVKD